MLIFGVLMVAGCRSAQPEHYSTALPEAMNTYSGVPAEPEMADDFVALFQGLSEPDWESRVRTVYAETLYFSDTLALIRTRDGLVEHFRRLHEAGVALELSVEAAVADGPDLYLRWHMQSRFRAAGRNVDSTTIGMTLLRFDDSGQVVLHQDYWDSTAGFYQHLPVLGGLLNWIGGRFDG